MKSQIRMGAEMKKSKQYHGAPDWMKLPRLM
jgi:hypothetical protein